MIMAGLSKNIPFFDMTEEDTFNALKRWTYSEALHYWFENHGPVIGSILRDKFLKPTGWSYSELEEAHRKIHGEYDGG